MGKKFKFSLEKVLSIRIKEEEQAIIDFKKAENKLANLIDEKEKLEKIISEYKAKDSKLYYWKSRRLYI